MTAYLCDNCGYMNQLPGSLSDRSACAKCNAYLKPRDRLEDRPGYPFPGQRKATDAGMNNPLSDAALGLNVPLAKGNPVTMGWPNDLMLPGRPDSTDWAYLLKLKPGEPFFILRAQDLMAPALVRLWCDLNIHNMGLPRERILDSRAIALAMEQWPHRKWPD